MMGTLRRLRLVVPRYINIKGERVIAGIRSQTVESILQEQHDREKRAEATTRRKNEAAGAALQRRRVRGGQARGRQKTNEATARDKIIVKYHERWLVSDFLQDQYRSESAYIAEKMGVSQRTIQRRLKLLDPKPRH